MAKLKMGWAEVDITPNEKINLQGQFYERVSDVVESRLYITALAIDNGEDQMIICSCDLASVAQNLNKMVKENLKGKLPISPDKVIDGSTSLFPETTWYIRDLHHDDFGQLHDPVLEIMRFDLDGDSEKYPRFLRNVNGGLQPADENKEAVKAEDNIFASAIRFFTAIINFIIKLIKK